MEASQSATMYQDTYSSLFGAQNILAHTVNSASTADSWLADATANACINTLTSSNSESWWTGRFKGQWDVNRIRILPDKLFGSSLGGAKVIVGNTECATIPEDVTAGEWADISCAPGPIAGNNIRIQKDAALLVFCGL